MNTLPPRPSSSAPYTDKRKDQSRRERRAEKYPEVEAGPSRPRPRELERDHEGDGNSRRKKRSKGKAKEKPILNGILNGLNGTDASKRQAANQTFEMGEDFVPFVASSEDEEQAPVREWDKGKGKARATKQDFENDREDGGKKRKYDLVFDDDDLIQQRREKTFRKTPWVTAVDWESCKNVAEMCVLIHFELRGS
jgi:non-canonical poly(A) RNA polymerase PAPD5/7